MPYSWRQKFDLDGYIPTNGTKIQLIQSCEAIERNQEAEKVKKNGETESKKRVKFSKKATKHSKGEGIASSMKYYCSVHGKNKSHNTVNCFSLKNQTTSNVNKPKKTFTNKGLCQEINFLAKDSSKEQVLDLYLSVINTEKAKLKKKSKTKKAKKEIQVDSDSDSDTSMAMLEQDPISKKRKIMKSHEKTEEEVAFLKAINAQDDSEEISD